MDAQLAQMETVYIDPPNPALSKLGGAIPPYIPEEMAARAEKAIGRQSSNFEIEMHRQVEAITSGIEVVAGTDQERMFAIYAPAHELRGQCGTFGHDLVGQVANQLCSYIEEAQANELRLESHVITLHVKSLRRVAEDEETARYAARRLLDNLARLSDKAINDALSNRKPPRPVATIPCAD